MVWNLVEDLEWGHFNEKKVLKWLNENEYSDDIFKLYKNEKKQVDFKNTKIIGELKSRTNNYSRYPTTFFGYNKIKYLLGKEGENRDFKFYFLFTDGLYCWDYKEGEYEIRDFDHRERGVKDYAYVPIEHLKCITTDIHS
tara:strand:- start:1722 stop:2141 length:420 start_codon:yes stop_codon:yes gene_type:complete